MAIRARKHFSQNFLTDANVIEQIAAAINPAQTDHILEIGPAEVRLLIFSLDQDVTLIWLRLTGISSIDLKRYTQMS